MKRLILLVLSWSYTLSAAVAGPANATWQTEKDAFIEQVRLFNKDYMREGQMKELLGRVIAQYPESYCDIAQAYFKNTLRCRAWFAISGGTEPYNTSIESYITRAVRFMRLQEDAKELLAEGYNPHIMTDGGATIVHELLSFKVSDNTYTEKGLSVLIKAGLDINARDDQGHTVWDRSYHSVEGNPIANKPYVDLLRRFTPEGQIDHAMAIVAFYKRKPEYASGIIGWIREQLGDNDPVS